MKSILEGPTMVACQISSGPIVQKVLPPPVDPTQAEVFPVATEAASIVPPPVNVISMPKAVMASLYGITPAPTPGLPQLFRYPVAAAPPSLFQQYPSAPGLESVPQAGEPVPAPTVKAMSALAKPAVIMARITAWLKRL